MKILAIMVAYNQDILSSKTFQSLKDALAKHDIEDIFSFLIYDNSLTPQNVDWEVAAPMSYKHDPTNAGLAKAYNYALDAGMSNSCDWLLLLDQDSTLPEDFVTKLIDITKQINVDENIVAIVPRVRCLGKMVSPSVVKFGGCFRPVDAAIKGDCHCQITSINSGTMIRSSFMKSIGGFNTLFRLDYLDHWVFSSIYSNNKRAFVSESVVEHELSIMDYDSWMNVERYESILKAERIFLETCRPKYENYFYILRLVRRIFAQLSDHKKAVFYKSTLQAFKNIILNNQDKGFPIETKSVNK